MNSYDEPVEYFGLGEQDDILEKDINKIVDEYNTVNDTSLIYSAEIEYWSVRSDPDPDYADFHMFVIFDSEYRAFAGNQAEMELIEAVLGAMEAYAERHGFPGEIRMTDEDYCEN